MSGIDETNDEVGTYTPELSHLSRYAFIQGLQNEYHTGIKTDCPLCLNDIRLPSELRSIHNEW